MTQAATPGQVSVAVLDDDHRIGVTIKTFLSRMKCRTTLYTEPKSCLSELDTNPVDILITDLRMPGMDGLSILKHVKHRSPGTDVIVLTGSAEKCDAIEALKLGAFDFFEKPVHGDELTETVSRTMRYRQLARERDLLAAQVSFFSEQERARWGISGFVSHSAGMQKIMRDVQLVQRAPKTTVLITGESGTGKELVSRAIHYGSPRADQPFVAVNCSAVPPDLAESTLFGHVKGAFTGAVADRKGCFELADGGTLFLDEIGDMPAEMQTKLLRVLEDSEITPVGGSRARRVDVRIVAATNADLADKIAARQFRSDLFYRLAGFTMALPPLRERKDEIPLLAEHFVNLLAAEMGFPAPTLQPEAVCTLMAHDFPGNVRELRNTIERALIESRGEVIRAEHIHCFGMAVPACAAATAAAADSTMSTTDELPLNLKQAEGALIRRAISASDGNIAAAARLLGVNRPKLYRMMAAQGIEAH